MPAATSRGYYCVKRVGACPRPFIMVIVSSVSDEAISVRRHKQGEAVYCLPCSIWLKKSLALSSAAPYKYASPGYNG